MMTNTLKQSTKLLRILERINIEIQIKKFSLPTIDQLFLETLLMEIRGKTIPSPVTHTQEKNNEREKQLMLDINTMTKT